jgi:hypothetical protein
MDVTSSWLCPMAGFGICGVQPSHSATTVTYTAILVYKWYGFCNNKKIYIP